MFKNSEFIPLPYDKQGLIYFTCHNYADQPQEVKRKIADLCKQCGGAHSQELFEFMTSNVTRQALCDRYHIDQTVLYRARKKLYKAWYGVK